MSAKLIAPSLVPVKQLTTRLREPVEGDGGNGAARSSGSRLRMKRLREYRVSETGRCRPSAVLAEAKVPVLRKRRLRWRSRAWMSRQMASTFFSSEVSDWMNVKEPLGFEAWHSLAMRAPASSERPMKYTRGLVVWRANCLRVASPMPLVAPTKTATRLLVREVRIWALEAWMALRETMMVVLEYGLVRRIERQIRRSMIGFQRETR